MRITTRIVAAGERWAADLPFIDAGKCFPWIDGKMVAQPDEVRRALNARGITHAKNDTSYLQCIVAQWLAKLGDWKDRNEIGREAKGYDQTVSRMGRRFENETITYARAEFKVKWRKGVKGQIITCHIETKNDGVVEKRKWEELFAWLMSEAAHVVSEELTDCGYQAIEFSEDAERLYRELKEWRRNERRRKVLKKICERRTICLRHRNGYCSPRLSFCPCYSFGKCVDARKNEEK